MRRKNDSSHQSRYCPMKEAGLAESQSKKNLRGSRKDSHFCAAIITPGNENNMGGRTTMLRAAEQKGSKVIFYQGNSHAIWWPVGDSSKRVIVRHGMMNMRKQMMMLRSAQYSMLGVMPWVPFIFYRTNKYSRVSQFVSWLLVILVFPPQGHGD